MLNIGGIANLTLIPSGGGDVVAFDTGPGNMVIDAVSAMAGATHDMDGHGAARGMVDRVALDELMRDPYFARRAPKSTGRERFGAAFAKRLHDLVAKHGHTHDDALATATMLTARSIGEAMRREARVTVSRLLIAGGGARNPTLMRMLADTIAPVRLEPTDAHGVQKSIGQDESMVELVEREIPELEAMGDDRALVRAFRLLTYVHWTGGHYADAGAARPVSGGALHLP